MNFKQLIITLLLNFTLAYFSKASTIESAASGNWNDVATWVGGAVPDVGDDVLIHSGHLVQLNIIASINGLTIEANGQLKIVESTGNLTTGNNLAIEGTLKIEGEIHVTGNGVTHNFTQDSVRIGINGTMFLECYCSITGPTGNSVWHPESGSLRIEPNANISGNPLVLNNTPENLIYLQDNSTIDFKIVNHNALFIQGAGSHKIYNDVENYNNLFWEDGDIEGNGTDTLFNKAMIMSVSSPSPTSAINFTIKNDASASIEINGYMTTTNTILNSGALHINLDGILSTTAGIENYNNIFVDGIFNMLGGTYSMHVQNNAINGSGTINFDANNSISGSYCWTMEVSVINLASSGINGDQGIVFSGQANVVNWYDSFQFTNSVGIKNCGSTFNLFGSGSHGFTSDFSNSGIVNVNEGSLGGGGGAFLNEPSVSIGAAPDKNLRADCDCSGSPGGILNIYSDEPFGTSLTNQGAINNFSNCYFNTYPVFNESSGTINCKDGFNLVIANSLLTNIGLIKGKGTLSADLTYNQGTVAPGNSPGTLIINGDYTNSSLLVEMEESGGIVDKDSLYVTGDVNLGGSLDIYTSGSIPAGEYVIIKSGGTVTGTFSAITGNPCANVIYGSDYVLVKFGVTKTWNGNTSTWTQDAEWTPYGVPCPDDDVIINTGICDLDISPDIKSLTINGGTLNNTGSFTIACPTTVSTNAVLNIQSATTLTLSDMLILDGLVEGYGTIDISTATIVGGYGKWAPGNSIGELTTKGMYNNEVIEMEISGNGYGGGGTIELDKLNVTQEMKVDDDFVLKWLGGTVPPGTRTLMECQGAGCRMNEFSSKVFPPQCQGGCSLIYTEKEVKLQNIEPIENIGPCKWTGLGGTPNWNNAGNWDCNDIPNFNDDVTIDLGSELVLSENTTIKSLSISNGSTIVGNYEFSVQNNFLSNNASYKNIASISVGNATLNGNFSLENTNFNFNEGGIINDAQISISQESNVNIPNGKTMIFNFDTNSSLASDNLSIFNNNGTISKTGNGILQFSPNVINNGIININEGGIAFKKNFTNNSQIKGNGTLDISTANIIKMGTISPGNSPGTLNITGNYTNDILVTEIEQTGGIVNIDKLIISGEMMLQGDLIIDHLGGSLPNGSYEFISCGGSADCRKNTQFSNVSFPAFCGSGCSLEYNQNNVKLMYEQGLPVELAYFTGRFADENVKLQWTTFSEKNAESFEVFRSINGLEWYSIGEVLANGTTNISHDYSFSDADPFPGDNYYRLKQHDHDNISFYSNFIRVKTPVKKTWRLYPNPVQNKLEIRFADTEEGLLKIFDATGRLIMKQNIEAEKSINVDLSPLANGLYWVQMTGFKTEMVVKY